MRPSVAQASQARISIRNQSSNLCWSDQTARMAGGEYRSIMKGSPSEGRGPDSGEATSSGASASRLRERAAQDPLGPPPGEVGRLGAEDPSRVFPAEPLILGDLGIISATG